MINLIIIGLSFVLLLSGCATEVRQRPGVMEAKSCMRHLNGYAKDYPDYTIRSCTNTGVWIVEQKDSKTGVMVAQYDFVNREYMGADTGGALIHIEALGGQQERDFIVLQKALNKALLE